MHGARQGSTGGGQVAALPQRAAQAPQRSGKLCGCRALRGVELFGIILLVLNFLDGLYKLARLNWHLAYQIAMTLLYVALSVLLIQLILAFRTE